MPQTGRNAAERAALPSPAGCDWRSWKVPTNIADGTLQSFVFSWGLNKKVRCLIDGEAHPRSGSTTAAFRSVTACIAVLTGSAARIGRRRSQHRQLGGRQAIAIAVALSIAEAKAPRSAGQLELVLFVDAVADEQPVGHFTALAASAAPISTLRRRVCLDTRLADRA